LVPNFLLAKKDLWFVELQLLIVDGFNRFSVEYFMAI